MGTVGHVLNAGDKWHRVCLCAQMFAERGGFFAAFATGKASQCPTIH